MSGATQSALAPGLARKVKKILETRTDSPELVNSLKALSTVYSENTPAARRGLRATIERRGLSINEEFLKASEQAQKALDIVDAELEGLAMACNRIAGALDKSKASTSELMEQTEKAKEEMAASEKRQELVATFLQSYQLTSEEVTTLREADVDEKFFAALRRVHEIHVNCKNLLRTHHQRAGLELMDVMAGYQEGAYERLCRWVQAECRALGDSDTPEVGDVLQTASRALRERPVLFKYCAEEVANTRHNALFRRFIAALTRGGPGGMPRPIEMHAHDPRRYVGDMAAWLHQALASERELAVALFGEEGSGDGDEGRGGGGGGVGEVSGPEAVSTSEILDRIFEGVCRPFKVRVEQVLTSTPGVLLAYRIANLLEFYWHLVTGMIGPDAQLSATLREAYEMASAAFQEQLALRGEKLVKYPPSPPEDLSPPAALQDGLAKLLEVVDEHEGAMEAPTGGKSSLSPVLGSMLQPLLEMCERSSNALLSPPTPAPPRRHAYLANCLSAISAALATRESAVAEEDAERVGHAVGEHVDALVGGATRSILAACGLEEKLERVQMYQQRGEGIGGGGQMAVDPSLSYEEMAGSLHQLFVQLSASACPVPEFTDLHVPRLRAEASTRVAQAVGDAYESVFSALLDPANGYAAAGTSVNVKHTPDQIRTILGA